MALQRLTVPGVIRRTLARGERLAAKNQWTRWRRDELFCEGLAGLGPQQAAADAAVLLHQEGEGEELFDVLLDVDLRGLVEGLVFGGLPRGSGERGIGDPGRVDAEVDQQVAVLLVSGDVEAGAEAEDADGVGAQPPGGAGGAGGEGVEIGRASCRERVYGTV